MKKLVFIFPFFIFCALSLLNNPQKEELSISSAHNNTKYSHGLNKRFKYNFNRFSQNSIIAKLDTSNHTLYIKQKTKWTNYSYYPTNEIWLKLDINSLKSNNTEYAQKNYLSDNEKTFVDDLNIKIDGKSKIIEYSNNFTGTSFDSTSAKIQLDSLLNHLNTVEINLEYKIKIPKPTIGLGYVDNRNFYLITDWLIRPAVYNKGKWHNYPTHAYFTYYNEFADYNIELIIPKSFVCGASSTPIKITTYKDSVSYYFNQNGMNSFSWFAGPNITKKESFYYRNDKSKVKINIYVQPEKERYLDRYVNIIKNSLEYLEDKLGEYPYNSITLVDLPRTYSDINSDNKNLIIIKSNLISPSATQQPEYDIAQSIAKQYFNGIIANDQISEPWLTNGFTKFFASKILKKYYGKGKTNFKIISYLPIYGLNIVSYNEIPLIYSLGDFPIEQWEKSLQLYYNNKSIGSINNNVFEFPNHTSYEVMTSIKPELMLLTLEKYIGEQSFNIAVKSYFQKFAFKHPHSNDLFYLFNRNIKKDLKWFVENTVNTSSYFDYKIKYIQKVKTNEYEVMAERLGDGIFENKIAFYTTKDTLYDNWNDNKKWKIFRFKTKNQIIGAEIDPDRDNYLDINFANNSYLVNPNYLITFSLTVRWFFWIQNALMILGSIV